MNSGFRVTMNVVLFAALAGIALASWFLRSDSARTNYEFLPDMAHSARYGAYSQNPNFEDTRTLRQPPAGVIARGNMPLHYTSSQSHATRAAKELTNPLGNGNENSLARGARVYANFCAVCHGVDAAGMGPVTQRGVPPPPSLMLPRAVQMKDGQMFHILTYGQNNMPSYASQVSPEDRWSVITYVRSMQAASIKSSLAVQNEASAGGKQ